MKIKMYIKKKVKEIIRFSGILDEIKRIDDLTANLTNTTDALTNRTNFLIYEVQKNLERHRWEDFAKYDHKNLREQTKDSFDFQWEELNTGKNLPSDKEFMDDLKRTICTYLGGVDQNFFKGKRIADVGCGMGRFTYGFLSMGAKVTAIDQSEHGLENVARLCNQWENNLSLKQLDLVNMCDEELDEQFDIVWCYGVVHHTGNTYLAMDKVCKLVRPNGIVFMMIYGFPDREERFLELSNYEKHRYITRNMSNREKVDYLKKIYPEDLVHGYFDAISPQINDILSFEEIKHFMLLEGFDNIMRTVDNGNIHFIAVKK